MNKQYLRDKVKTIEVKERKISELIREMQDVSFQGRSLGEAYNVLKKMLLDKYTTIIMGISGSLSTAGMWKIIKWLIDENYIDVLVSTGANMQRIYMKLWEQAIIRVHHILMILNYSSIKLIGSMTHLLMKMNIQAWKILYIILQKH